MGSDVSVGASYRKICSECACSLLVVGVLSRPGAIVGLRALTYAAKLTQTRRSAHSDSMLRRTMLILRHPTRARP